MKRKLCAILFSVLFCVPLAACHGKAPADTQVINSTTTNPQSSKEENITTTDTTTSLGTTKSIVDVTSGTTTTGTTTSPTKPSASVIPVSSVDHVPSGTAVSFEQNRVILNNIAEAETKNVTLLKTTEEFQKVYDSEHEAYQSASLKTESDDFPACYDKEFFDTNTLVLVADFMSGGNIIQKITALTITDDTLYVSYRRETTADFGADALIPFRDFLAVKKSDIASITAICYFVDDCA